ncbi:hypothetical protein ACFQ80_05980 [Isoptericola sp. NPDC056578]
MNWNDIRQISDGDRHTEGSLRRENVTVAELTIAQQRLEGVQEVAA